MATPLVLAPNVIIPLVKGLTRKKLEFADINDQCLLLPIRREDVDGMSNDRWRQEGEGKKFVLMYGVDYDYAQNRTLTSILSVGNFLQETKGAVVYLSKKDHDKIAVGKFPHWFQTLVEIGGEAVEGEILKTETIEFITGKRVATDSKIFYNSES